MGFSEKNLKKSITTQHFHEKKIIIISIISKGTFSQSDMLLYKMLKKKIIPVMSVTFPEHLAKKEEIWN